MSLAEDFYQWTTDPARTSDELYPAEMLVERGWQLYQIKHKLPFHFNWDAIHRLKRERNENPAYRPRIADAHIKATLEMWEEIKEFSDDIGSMRPIRDLSVLRFFPHIETFALRCSEIADLSNLAGLRSLKKFSLSEFMSPLGHALVDLSPLAGLPHLTEVTLHITSPWPELSALATLPALRTLGYTGNLLALEVVPSLPAVESAGFCNSEGCSTPVRDLHALPAMPNVRLLSVGKFSGIHPTGITKLDGIERYPHLVNLSISGVFRDLRPLAALSELTCITIFSELFRDITPLAVLPLLREITLIRERPLDIEPLATAPALREISLPRCLILETELNALRAGLLSWNEDFLAPEPRPLPPLRWFCYEPQNPESQVMNAQPPDTCPRKKRYAGDPALLAASHRWVAAEIKRRLNALLGEGWSNSNGGLFVEIQRYQDVQRVPEIVECLRRLSAESLDPITYFISIEPHGDIVQDGWRPRRKRKQGSLDWLECESTVDEEIEDRMEYRRYRDEHFRRLENEHRLEILQQQGQTIDPKDFSPPTGIDALGAPETQPDPEEADDAASAGFDTNEDDENEDAGGIAEPPPAPPGTPSLGRQLSFSLRLSEQGAFVSKHQLDDALAALDVNFENWHELPIPPEDRPSLR
jgi:hypothetical protein